MSIPPSVPHTTNDPSLDTIEAHEFEIPCDALNRAWHPTVGTGPARWVLRFDKCCGSRACLFCDGCKDQLLTAPLMVSVADGHKHSPARTALRSMDAL